MTTPCPHRRHTAGAPPRSSDPVRLRLAVVVPAMQARCLLRPVDLRAAYEGASEPGAVHPAWYWHCDGTDEVCRVRDRASERPEYLPGLCLRAEDRGHVWALSKVEGGWLRRGERLTLDEGAEVLARATRAGMRLRWGADEAGEFVELLNAHYPSNV